MQRPCSSFGSLVATPTSSARAKPSIALPPGSERSSRTPTALRVAPASCSCSAVPRMLLWLLACTEHATYLALATCRADGYLFVPCTPGTSSRGHGPTSDIDELCCSVVIEPSDGRRFNASAVDALRSPTTAAWLESSAEFPWSPSSRWCGDHLGLYDSDLSSSSSNRSRCHDGASDRERGAAAAWCRRGSAGRVVHRDTAAAARSERAAGGAAATRDANHPHRSRHLLDFSTVDMLERPPAPSQT